jgi:hypothetical protein
MQPSSCQQREQYIPKRNYEFYWGRFIFADHSYKDGPLNLLLVIYTWDLGVRFDNYFLVHFDLNLIYSDEFSGYILPSAEGRAIVVYFSQPVNCR